MKRLTILVLLLTSISMGCLGTVNPSADMPKKPARPPLDVEQQEDGGMCLDKQDTYLLFDYILRLEEGYK